MEEEDGDGEMVVSGKTKYLIRNLDRVGLWNQDVTLIHGTGEFPSFPSPSSSSSSSPSISSSSSPSISSSIKDISRLKRISKNAISELHRAGRNVQNVDVVDWRELTVYGLLLRRFVVLDLESLGWLEASLGGTVAVATIEG